MPAVGFRNLVSRLKTVDLPAPFGPISALIWPSWTSMSTSLTATKPANSLRRPRAESTGASPRRVRAVGGVRAGAALGHWTRGQPLLAGSMKASFAGTVARTL